MAAGDKIREILQRITWVCRTRTPTLLTERAPSFEPWLLIWKPQGLSDKARWRAFNWRQSRRIKTPGSLANSTSAPYTGTLVGYFGYPTEDPVVKDSSGTVEVGELIAVDTAILCGALEYSRPFDAIDSSHPLYVASEGDQAAVSGVNGFSYLGSEEIKGAAQHLFSVSYMETF